MSQIDKNTYPISESNRGIRQDGEANRRAFLNQMSLPIGEVTSRNQIIDPYTLVDPSNYRQTRAGKAEYNSDLQQAQRYAEMQEAAYQEWYNDPAQAAARERSAGLNPDLVGLSDAGDASNTETNPNSPIAGLASNGELAQGWINTIMSCISAASGAASAAKGFAMLPAETGLMSAQADALGLANIEAFERVASKDVAGRLATAFSAAGSAGLDVAKWFEDDNNFAGVLEAYAPSDDPRYSAALGRVRQQLTRNLGEAYKVQGDTAFAGMSTARELADPRYADGQLINQINYIKPLMELYAGVEGYKAELEATIAKVKKKYAEGINVDTAVDAANKGFVAAGARSDYESEYYGTLDGEVQAAYEQMTLKSNALMLRAQQAIKENYFATWRKYPSSMRGISAANIVLDGSIAQSPKLLLRYLLETTEGVTLEDIGEGVGDTLHSFWDALLGKKKFAD